MAEKLSKHPTQGDTRIEERAVAAGKRRGPVITCSEREEELVPETELSLTVNTYQATLGSVLFHRGNLGRVAQVVPCRDGEVINSCIQV